MKLGDRLRLLRKRKGLTQTEFAERMGIPNQNVSNYERDFRQPDYETLKRFADYFEVSTDYLLGLTEIPAGPDKTEVLSSKDEKDMAKRMAKMKRDLIEGRADGQTLLHKGEPMSEEAMESLLEALEMAERITTLANKKYAPNKYKDKE